MSRIVPALKGRMGDIDYYALTLKAASLTNYVRMPQKIPGWSDLTIEEQFQREINIRRVKEQLAPYLAEYPSHFFGSIIVAPISRGSGGEFNASSIVDSFEPITDFKPKNMPQAYNEPAACLGFLTIPDSTILVSLDGQHRVKAIEFAINGKDGDGNVIEGFTPNIDLADEDISVLLVDVDTQKARSVFTHVNRYAKPTSTGLNYITSDDDILAVISREIVSQTISIRLVKYKTNTLAPNDYHLTTLSTVYNCMKEIAKLEVENLDTTRLPDQPTARLLREKGHETWRILLSKIEFYKKFLDAPDEEGDEYRIKMRSQSLLGRPVAQECMFRAFLWITRSPTNLTTDSATERMNKLPWDMTNRNVEKFWQNVLWLGNVKEGRMITKNRIISSELIYYLAGGKLNNTQTKDLKKRYAGLFTESNKPTRLPKVQV